MKYLPGQFIPDGSLQPYYLDSPASTNASNYANYIQIFSTSAPRPMINVTPPKPPILSFDWKKDAQQAYLPS